MPRALSPLRNPAGDWLDSLMNQKTYQVQSRYRSNATRCLEVPPYLQGVFWKSLVLTDKVSLVSASEYAGYLAEDDFKFQSEIRRDINRTFPNLRFFQEVNSLGQGQLFNVLKAYSVFNPEVGYCQGMGFIVGLLLSHMNGVDAFNVLVALMRPDGEYNMQGLYKPGLPLLNEYLSQLDRMIATDLPRLAHHFASLGIETSMFASQWILTLLVYSLEWTEAIQIFNIFLVYKIDVILKFSIFTLQRVEKDILGMSFEETLGKINDMRGVRVLAFVEWVHRTEERARVEAEAGRLSGNETD